MVKTDSSGKIQWDEHLRIYRYCGAATGRLTDDGGYIIIGWGHIPMVGYEFCLLKLGGEPGVQKTFFTLSSQQFAEVDFKVANSKMGDVDGDGDLDIIFSGYNGTAAGRIYLNDGSGNFIDSGQAIGARVSG